MWTNIDVALTLHNDGDGVAREGRYGQVVQFLLSGDKAHILVIHEHIPTVMHIAYT